jgi:hypothetical protein
MASTARPQAEMSCQGVRRKLATANRAESKRNTQAPHQPGCAKNIKGKMMNQIKLMLSMNLASFEKCTYLPHRIIDLHPLLRRVSSRVAKSANHTPPAED